MVRTLPPPLPRHRLMCPFHHPAGLQLRRAGIFRVTSARAISMQLPGRECTGDHETSCVLCTINFDGVLAPFADREMLHSLTWPAIAVYATPGVHHSLSWPAMECYSSTTHAFADNGTRLIGPGVVAAVTCVYMLWQSFGGLAGWNRRKDLRPFRSQTLNTKP